MDVYLLKVVSHPNMTEPGFLDMINSWEMNCIHHAKTYSLSILNSLKICCNRCIVHDFIDNISNLPFSFVVIYG